MRRCADWGWKDFQLEKLSLGGGGMEIGTAFCMCANISGNVMELRNHAQIVEENDIS